MITSDKNISLQDALLKCKCRFWNKFLKQQKWKKCTPENNTKVPEVEEIFRKRGLVVDFDRVRLSCIWSIIALMYNHFQILIDCYSTCTQYNSKKGQFLFVFHFSAYRGTSLENAWGTGFHVSVLLCSKLHIYLLKIFNSFEKYQNSAFV